MKLISIVLAVLLAASATASAQESEFNVEGYQALEAELEELDFARVATASGSEERLNATIAAITHRRAIIHYISGWLREGTVPDGAEESARMARLILVENIVQLSVEIGHCGDAEDSLTLIEGFGASGDLERQAAYDSAVQAVTECVDARETASDSEGLSADGTTDGPTEADTNTEEGRDGEDPDGAQIVVVTEPAEAESSPAGLVLLGVGAVTVVAGATWNLALLGDASDYRTSRDACESGELEECGTAERLRSDLAGVKAPIAALVGGGLVLATVGTILHVRADGRRSERDVGLLASPEFVGIRIRVRAGGRVR